jgi:hypothetical protein
VGIKLGDFLGAIVLAGSAVLTGGLSLLPGVTALGALAAAAPGIALTALLGVYSGSRARAAARTSLTENRFNTSSAASPKFVLYGRDRVSGFRIYEKTFGDRGQYVTRIYGLGSHEYDAIEDVLFDDISLGTLDGNGYPTGGRYVRGEQRALTAKLIHAGIGSNITLPDPPADSVNFVSTFVGIESVAVQIPTTYQSGDYEGNQTVQSGESLTLKEGTEWTQAGRVVTMTTATYLGLDVIITYRVNVGKAYVKVLKRLGASTGRTVGENAELLTNSGGEWTNDHKLCSIPHLEVTFIFDPTIYPAGFPNVTAICKGKKVYDPQTATTAWSNSPALCWRDYMVNKVGVAASLIDDTSVIAAKTACATTYTTATGSQAGYTCDGICSSTATHQQNLSQILTSMLGAMANSGGKWFVGAGEWSAPVLTLNESALADALPEVQSRAPARDRCNVVRGKYRDARGTTDAPNGLYAVTDYPEFASSTYITEDLGRRFVQTLDLPMTLDHERSQRIGKRWVLIRRQALTVDAEFNMLAFKVRPMERVRLPWTEFGWAGTYDGGTGKVFRVLRYRFNPATNTVALSLIEDAQALYDWNFSEADVPDASANTDRLNAGFVDQPKNLRLTSSANTYTTRAGVIVPYIDLEIDQPSANDVEVEVWWKRAADAVYGLTRMGVGVLKVRLEGVSGGELVNVYAIATNSAGARSLPLFVLPGHTVSPDLPRNGTGAIASANLLMSASFDNGNMGLWGTPYGIGIANANVSFQRDPDASEYVAGSPSSANLSIVDGSTGVGKAGGVPSELFSVTPGARYCAFTGAIPWACDGFCAIAWYDVAQNLLGTTNSNIVAGTTVGNPTAKWADPDAYEIAEVFASPPAGARFARMILLGGGTFQAGPYKYVSFHKPFFGEVPAGVTTRPVWGPGSGNPIDTRLLSPRSVNQIVVPPTDVSGFSLDLQTLVFSDKTLGLLVAEAAGSVSIKVTCEVTGSSQGGAPSSISLGITQTGKLPLVSREVLSAIPSGETRKWSGTLTANIPSVLAGESILPRLRLSRTRFGLGVGNTTDRVTLIDCEIKLTKV